MVAFQVRSLDRRSFPSLQLTTVDSQSLGADNKPPRAFCHLGAVGESKLGLKGSTAATSMLRESFQIADRKPVDQATEQRRFDVGSTAQYNGSPRPNDKDPRIGYDSRVMGGPVRIYWNWTLGPQTVEK
jgi:hypothetical protein